MSVILVAEQDAGYGEKIAQTLKSEGWTAQTVDSRDAAFRAATVAKPRLLLANANLPEAPQLLAAFSRLRGGPGAIVLVPAATPETAKASDYQADALLRMPADEATLKGAVRSLLQLAGHGAAKTATATSSGANQQLTSADIFGDVLAEVEAEASRSRRAASKARLRASNDEIERKLEETLSGVFPMVDKPRSSASPTPSRSAQRPASGRTKRRTELPTDQEIDNLLDKTLSSLELPTRSRKTANRATPAAQKKTKTPSRPAAPPSGALPSGAGAGQAGAPKVEVPRAEAPSMFDQPGDEALATQRIATGTHPQLPEQPAAPASPGEPPAFSPLKTEDSIAPLPTLDSPPTFESPPSFEAPPTLESPPAFTSQPAQLPVPGFETPSASEAAQREDDFDIPESAEPPAAATSHDLPELGEPLPPPAEVAPSAAFSGFEPSPDRPFGPEGSSFAAPSAGSAPTLQPGEAAEAASAWDSPKPSSASPTGSDAFAIEDGDPWSELRELSSPASFGQGTPSEEAQEPPSTEAAPAFGALEPASAASPATDETANPWQTIEPPEDLFPQSFADSTGSGFTPLPTATAAGSGSDTFQGTAPTPLESAPEAPRAAPPDGDPMDRFRSFLDEVDTSTTDAAPNDVSPFAASSFAPPAVQPDTTPPESSNVESPEAALQGVLELRGDSETSGPQAVGSGQPFGDYTLLERIAVGGMAEVWRARRSGVEGFQKTVAIKKILSHLTDSPDFVNMFIDEAKLAAQLTHSNIIQIYDLGKVGEDFFIAMELVDGKDLRTILKKSHQLDKPLPTHLALMIVAALARALDYAHRKKGFDDRALGLVHRDVSPQNVLIGHEGEIKLCDFGIVKAVAKASTTQMGALKGKLQYMSPEQAWGKSVDARSDIFSLGSVLFEVLTGEKLFIGDSEIGVLDAVRECRVRSLQEMLPELPAEIDRIVHKALEKDPADRYQTAGEMEQDLQDVLRQMHASDDAKELAAYMASLFGRHLEAPALEPMSDASAVYVPPPPAVPEESAEALATDTSSPPPVASPEEKGKGADGGSKLKKPLLAALAALLLAALVTAGYIASRPSTEPSATSTTPAASPATVPPVATTPNDDPPAAEGTDPLAAPVTEDGAAATAPEDTLKADELDIEALVKQGLDAQQSEMKERLESEYEAKKKALEEKLAETQRQAEATDPPPDDN